MKEKKFSRQIPLRVLVFFLILGFSALFAGENPLRVLTVQDQFYRITGLNLNVNVTFLVAPVGVLVIDSGTNPVEGQWIIEKIKEKTNKPIKYVVLTHYHFDHSAGLMGFPKEVTVCAHDRCRRNISQYNENRRQYLIQEILPAQIKECSQEIEALKKQKNPGVNEKQKELDYLTHQLEEFKKENIVYPAITFEQNLTLWIGEEKIEILYPGSTHSNCSVLVYIPGKKIVISGDTLFNGFVPYIDWKTGSNTRNWIDCLARLSQWDIETVIPGHGEPGGKTLLVQQKQFLIDLRATVQQAIDKKETLEEMKKNIQMNNYNHLGFQPFLSLDIESVFNELTNEKDTNNDDKGRQQ
ncbi:MAG: MBL fold metallo-hydrolase [Acidobacteria bacterium]|nr:MBL fold metallo-hydrolase [Acidobacteriota bacterium]